MKTTHTGLTAAAEFRGGRSDLVTVPLEPFAFSEDTANRLVTQERPADLFATPYFVLDAEIGSLYMPDEVEAIMNANYPALAVAN